ncbi:MAG: AgmX/PglI C-terminal domain-containing protein [Pseudomonadota bacterium]
MSTCREITELLSQSLDGQLGQKDRIEVRRHLMNCAACTRVQQQLMTVRGLVRQHRDSVEGGGIGENVRLPPAARQRIAATLAASASQTPGLDTEAVATEIAGPPSAPRAAAPRPEPTPNAIQVFVFRDGAFVGTEVATGTRLEIGRDLTCDVVLSDDLVSRRHAAVTLFRQQLYVEDLSSSNGTYVSGQAIATRQPISHRDDVGIGRHALKFKLLGLVEEDEAAPTMAAADYPEVTERDHIEAIAAARPSPEAAQIFDALVESDATDSDPPPRVRPQSTYERTDREPSYDPPAVAPPPPPAPPPARELLRPAFAPVPATPGPNPMLDEMVVSGDLSDEETSLSDPYGSLPPIERPDVEALRNRVQAATADAREPAPPRALEPDETDEDFDPDDLPAPFSLFENLLRENFQGGRVPQQARAHVEVIRYQDQVVHDLTALAPGQQFVVGRGLGRGVHESGTPANLRLVRVHKKGSAEITVLRTFDGKVRLGSQSRNLRDAATWDGDRGSFALQRGDMANLQIGVESYFVRFAQAPDVERQISARGRRSKDEARELRGLLVSLLSSGAGHALILIGLFVAGLVSPSQLATNLDEDRFVQMDQKDLELEKPPEEEPPVEEAAPEEEAPAEEAPPPEKEPPKRSPRPQRPTNPEAKSPKPGILAALGKIPKVGGAAGSQTLTAAVSNLDAVKVPGGGGSYKVSGLIGKGPTNRVQIGGSGGGVSTKGLNSILREGGGGPGSLSKLKSGTVRGRLVKATRASRTQGSGVLDRAEIQKVVNKGLGQIQFCYEKELLKNNSLSGKVVFEWTIGLNGSVQIVKTTTSTLKSPAAVQCMIGAVKGWKFPAPRGGTVIVTYPFIFNAMGF